MAVPRFLFLTGKLAEPALRRQVAEIETTLGFESEIVVLPITVAALLTTPWVARHVEARPGFDRAILPGFCTGELAIVSEALKVPAERGPRDLRDLPEYLGSRGTPPQLNRHEIEILAEINHAPKKSLNELLSIAAHFRASGADVIDIGCDPGSPWPGVGDAVRALKDQGHRVSIDSFDPGEVRSALESGAELVLSVNTTNVAQAVGWYEKHGTGVVAIPDTPTDAWSLERCAEFLSRHGVPHRLDPILEPIGFGFANSLGRYLECRRRHPQAEILMGVGNLTELTDADSAGINVLLAGFCQEIGIRSVLTTEVGNWARSSVKEFDLARRLVYHAMREKVLPKRLMPELILLRDPKLHEQDLKELAGRITDPNYRIFAERGELHILNGSVYLHGTDPFTLFDELLKHDSKLDASHAFYLGYELAKAATALTLGKQYVQDRELRWGFLTMPDA